MSVFDVRSEYTSRVRKILRATLHSSVFVQNNRRPNRNLEISVALTKSELKSHEPAYLQALIQNKIDRQRVRSREQGHWDIPI